MADNKKVESPKAGAAAAEASDKKEAPASPAEANKTKEPVQDQTPNTTPPASADDAAPARVPVDQPGEQVKPPSVDEVKKGAEVTSVAGTSKSGPTPEENLKTRVEGVAKSVETYNESNKAVEEAKPFVKPEVKTRPYEMPEDRLKKQVENVAKSTEAFNESAKLVEKSTPEQSRPGDVADKAAASAKAETSRVAPLTGELRPDPENDSYVTPGRTLAPTAPTPGDAAAEVEQAPLVIDPLSGAVRPADETSYPTPGHVRDTNLAAKALEKNKDVFFVEKGKGKFGVAPGQQVSLLHANEELWAGDQARLEDQKARAKEIAEALVLTDGLRRTRRVQKNLR